MYGGPQPLAGLQRHDQSACSATLQASLPMTRSSLGSLLDEAAQQHDEKITSIDIAFEESILFQVVICKH